MNLAWFLKQIRSPHIWKKEMEKTGLFESRGIVADPLFAGWIIPVMGYLVCTWLS